MIYYTFLYSCSSEPSLIKHEYLVKSIVVNKRRSVLLHNYSFVKTRGSSYKTAGYHLVFLMNGCNVQHFDL